MEMAQAKVVAIAVAALLLSSCGYRYSWEKFPIDGHRTGVSVPTADNPSKALGNVDGDVYTAPNGKVFEGGSTPTVARLLSEVQPEMAHLKEVVAFAPEALVKDRPESALSNFIVDRLFADVAEAVGPRRRVDLAITNFGGIRVDIPQGDVLLDDIVSMLPFANHLSYVQVQGSDLRAVFEYMAEHGVQCVSNVKLHIKGRKLVSAEVGGRPLDDSRLYGLATIDFMLDGGDGYKLARNARDYVITDIRIGDAILADVRAMTAKGQPLAWHTDGRVIIEEE